MTAGSMRLHETSLVHSASLSHNGSINVPVAGSRGLAALSLMHEASAQLLGVRCAGGQHDVP